MAIPVQRVRRPALAMTSAQPEEEKRTLKNALLEDQPAAITGRVELRNTLPTTLPESWVTALVGNESPIRDKTHSCARGDKENCNVAYFETKHQSSGETRLQPILRA
jgi:hypothetical protein